MEQILRMCMVVAMIVGAGLPRPRQAEGSSCYHEGASLFMPDGRVLYAGSYERGGDAFRYSFAVIRLNADGGDHL